MWGKIKGYVALIVSAILVLLGFRVGSKMNQAKHDSIAIKKLKKAQEKAKEADDEANKAKATINSANVVDKLNKL